MDIEQRHCQACATSFAIAPEDFSFYKKIDVPPPTWCIQCRMQRRMAFAADSMTLFSRVCQAPGHSEKVFSVYPEMTKAPVYDPAFWVSDGWDARTYSRDYDFNRSFFSQFKELLDAVPVRSTEVINSVRSDYSLGVTDSKNCYWCSGTFGSENCMYGHTAVFSKESVDLTISTAVEQCYDLFSVDKSFRTTSSLYSDELLNCDFMYDCRGCSDSLGCVGLRNKRFCIFNKQFTREEYKKERARYDLGGYAGRVEVQQRFQQLILQYPRKFAVIRNAPNSTGQNLINVKNCRFAFEALNDSENCAYCFVLGYGAKDSQDVAGAGLKAELLYDSISVTASSDVAFSYRIRNSRSIRYSRECFDSEYLFGCAGLRSKKYCILNKQYQPDEYWSLVGKIRKQMDEILYKDRLGREYRYGEFMPPEHSLFPYTNAWAKDFFPETEDSAKAKGFNWYERAYSDRVATISSGDIPDHCRDASNEIVKEAIECANAEGGVIGCIGVFRIIPAELAFYKKFNIALPRLCPFCRYAGHLKNFLPYQLWERRCECVGSGKQRTGYLNTKEHRHGQLRCDAQFETGYASNRPEMLYCEECYNAEIL